MVVRNFQTVFATDNELALYKALRGMGSGLPNQATHAGEFLYTDGTDASWMALTGGGDMLAANNLSDVANASTSLTNIGGLAIANNLSDVADEATSLYNIAKIKSGKFSLNTSQIFNLDTAPYSLASVFPAVAGHFWVGISCVMDYTLNTVEFDNRINIGASTCPVGGGIWLFNMSGYAADVIGAATIRQGTAPDSYVVNDFLHIGSIDAATTGDGSAIFYITAMLIEA